MRNARSIEAQLAAVALAVVAGCGAQEQEPSTATTAGSAESELHAPRCRAVELEASRGYQPTRWSDASKHLDAPFEFTLPASAPIAEGNSGKGWLQLTFVRAGVTTTCLYRGGERSDERDEKGKPEERGSRYAFSDCSSGERPGAVIRTQDLALHIDSGEKSHGTTRVKLAIEERKPCGGAVDRCALVLPAELDDGNPCTTDACDPAVGPTHAPSAAGTSCSDANACNGSETCDGAGVCASGTAPAIDDGNACTADACDPQAGVTHTPERAGTSCRDANACNGVEACDGAGSCAAGAAPSLDDGNPCTADACDAAAGVTHAPVAAGSFCGDGNACNGAETCDGEGRCLGGFPIPVDDGNPCTADGCDATDGVFHAAVALGTSCSDGNACNGSESCDDAGSCTSGAAPVTDDGNPCTADACDAVAGVLHLPLNAGASCGDGDACNGDELCDGAGSCRGGAAPVRDDGNSCTADACDPVAGVTHTALAAGASCADGNACNGAETCDGAGSCLAGSAPVVDDRNPCTADFCDRVTGVGHVPMGAGSACSDGNACNGVETCNATGTCLAGTAPVIDDGNACTVDTCDPARGVVHASAPAGLSCGDGNACNGAETCSAAGSCQAGAAPVVDDRNPCTADSCDPVAGVRHTPIAQGTPCDDGNACNGFEACDASGTCKAFAPPPPFCIH